MYVCMCMNNYCGKRGKGAKGGCGDVEVWRWEGVEMGRCEGVDV